MCVHIQWFKGRWISSSTIPTCLVGEEGDIGGVQLQSPVIVLECHVKLFLLVGRVSLLLLLQCLQNTQSIQYGSPANVYSLVPRLKWEGVYLHCLRSHVTYGHNIGLKFLHFTKSSGVENFSRQDSGPFEHATNVYVPRRNIHIHTALYIDRQEVCSILTVREQWDHHNL